MAEQTDLAARVLAIAERIGEEDNQFGTASAGWTWWQEIAEELAESATALARAVVPPCDHEDGSTTYLRTHYGSQGVFEDTCDTCGEVLTARTLAQIEEAAPGFTAATDRVGETSLPTPGGLR